MLKKSESFAILMMLFISTYSRAQSFDWVKAAGGAGAAKGTSIVVDSKKNILVCGRLNGSAAFGTDSIKADGSFLVKYDGTGQTLWSVPLPGLSCRGICADINGSVFITGYFSTASTVSGYTFSSNGKTDYFLIKFNEAGKLIWAITGGGPGNDMANTVACDYSGHVYIAGSFENYMNLDTATSLVSSGKGDIFIAQYDGAGKLQWADKAGGIGEDAGIALGVNLLGFVYLTGYFSGDAVFYKQTETSKGGSDIFLVKYHPLGLQLSLKTYGSAGDDFPAALGMDGSGNIYITGTCNGTIDFDGKQVSSRQNDAFVALFDNANMTARWSRCLGGTGNDAGLGISADGQENVTVTGVFTGTGDFGGISLRSNGKSDIFIARFDASGRVLWADHAGGAGEDSAFAAFVDLDDATYITGNFSADASFGSIDLKAHGPSNYFFAKMPPEPTGIDKKEFLPGLLVYPNPASDYIYITHDENDIISADIMDIEGKKCTAIAYNPGKNCFDISRLANGLYFVEIRTKAGQFVEKVVKK